jgi:hypothetical protein
MVLLEGKYAALPVADGASWLLCWHRYHLPMHGDRNGRRLDVNNGEGE